MSIGKAVGAVVGFLFVLAFVSVMFTIIVAIGIWPGEAKLTAPLLCPADRSDAFVVSDTTNPRPGETVVNFSLNCVGEHGEVTDVGFFRPFMLLVAFHAAIFTPLLLLGAVRRRRTTKEINADLADFRGQLNNRPSPAPVASSSPFGDEPPPFIDSSTKGPFD